MNLTILQNLIILYWFLFQIEYYFQYRRYIDMGLQPKYAFEKVESL